MDKPSGFAERGSKGSDSEDFAVGIGESWSSRDSSLELAVGNNPYGARKPIGLEEISLAILEIVVKDATTVGSIAKKRGGLSSQLVQSVLVSSKLDPHGRHREF